MVSLSKNQTVSLAKTTGSSLTRVAVGLGWDPIRAEPLTVEHPGARRVGEDPGHVPQ